MKIVEDIEGNIKNLESVFEGCSDIVAKAFVLDRADRSVKIYVVYVDGLSDGGMVDEVLLKPLSYEWRGSFCRDIFNSIFYKELQTADVKREKDFDSVLNAVLKGDTAVFVDGFCEAFIIASKKLPVRGIGENDSEAGMRGPKDSFTESLRQSTALIRRRIKDPKLKVIQDKIGERTATDYAMLYIEDLAEEKLVQELKDKLNRYRIDGILDSGMAEQLMEEGWRSPFPMFQSTARPDKVAAAVLEGRVAIVFDNSPEAVIAPANINILFQAADDYYNRWTVGSFARIIRYIAAFIALTLPGFYVAVTVYHSEMLPTKLLYAIAAARTMVTFPIIFEVVIMDFFFELLREAGIRLPGPLGNTIGVVGGLIVGQAAVDAGIVSTIVVIVVALTAISSFAIPNEVFASVFRLLKYFILLCSSLLGLYGFIIGLIAIVIHLSGLVSFGVPYLYPVAGRLKEDETDRDFFLRQPILKMKYRPFWAKSDNRTRLSERGNNVHK